MKFQGKKKGGKSEEDDHPKQQGEGSEDGQAQIPGGEQLQHDRPPISRATKKQSPSEHQEAMVPTSERRDRTSPLRVEDEQRPLRISGLESAKTQCFGKMVSWTNEQLHR